MWNLIFPSLFVVCDDTCKEVIMDPTNELLVCTISGRCFDRLLSPAEMEPDAVRHVPFLLDIVRHRCAYEAK